MAYERLAYDDQDTTAQMHQDCTACSDETALSDSIARAALGKAPSIAYDDFPREIRKPEITVTEATALLAARLGLHLD
jgi:hypothetical protein